MPNKKEIKVLKYLNKVESRYDNNKRGDTEENIKIKLNITNNDIGDMHYSKFLNFSSISTGNGLKNVICITHEGSAFIENVRYEKLKEVFYWIFGLASIIAAIFAAWPVLK